MDVASIQWITLVGSFLGVAVWETFQGDVQLRYPAGRRWSTHAAVYVISIILAPLILRSTPVVAALQNDGGYLATPGVPGSLQFLLTFVSLDVAQYLAHRLMHKSALLWRFHEIHHSDPDYDVATGFRFHPMEITLITGAQLAVVLVLGPPAWAVVAAQAIAIATNCIAHANASFRPSVERILRLFFITPSLHRLHHSSNPADFDRNFGQTLVIWDRLFRTVLEKPANGYRSLVTGVAEVSGDDATRLGHLLLRPFRRR